MSKVEPSNSEPVKTAILERSDLRRALPRLDAFLFAQGHTSPSRRAGWLEVLAQGLEHEPYCFEATRSGRTVGLLPLVHVRSRLFGRFLVGLPYLNVGGVVAEDPAAAAALVDRAVELADRLDVRYLELRHEQAVEHPALNHTLTSKVHMRLALPESSETLWSSFSPKVRNQIRKGQKQDFEAAWGKADRLEDFYAVFSRNMRDLGTPVFGRRLFESVLTCFPDEAEICSLRLAGRPVAAALLVHGRGMTEVPSASSLRRFNPSNANMFLYWLLLQRAIERGQRVFDFGRSSQQSNTYRFKSQWGATPEPAVWQYYVRQGNVSDMRLESGKYALATRAWRRLPLWLTLLLGPRIVRGIP